MLSVIDPSPSLPLLLEALERLSPSFLVVRGINKDDGRLAARVGGEDLAVLEGDVELEMDARRGELLLCCERLSTLTFVTDTDGVAGVTEGRFALKLRRVGVPPSKSRCLRFGDE